MKKKVLITGGPVHAWLDAVKKITNDFKGGRMAQLAEDLLYKGCEVHYLCSPGSATVSEGAYTAGVHLYTHNGFDEYKKMVLEMAPDFDAVILGAAVANLIPANPWKGKFPSHNYKEGDIINIPFIVAPRVINMVKAVAPKTHVIGFKLLKNVPHQELINAAYDIVTDAKATVVFANDRNDLDTIWPVFKEKSDYCIDREEELADTIIETIHDEYYHTEVKFKDHLAPMMSIMDTIARYSHRFIKVGDKYFGTVAIRSGSGFYTTARGKESIDNPDDIVFVESVDHKTKTVVSLHKKPTLNAPLLHHIFNTNPEINVIVHWHVSSLNMDSFGFPVLLHAVPGTVRDSIRDIDKSFVIQGHGAFELIR